MGYEEMYKYVADLWENWLPPTAVQTLRKGKLLYTVHVLPSKLLFTVHVLPRKLLYTVHVLPSKLLYTVHVLPSKLLYIHCTCVAK